MTAARLFVALELGDELRAKLAAFGRAAAQADDALRAVGEEALHVTLAFLGHRPVEEIAPAREAVRGVGGAELPELALGEALWLAPRRPHVLTVAIADGDGALAALQATVVERLAGAIAWEPERRRFRPHVTVARVRRDGRPRVADLPPAPRGRFAACAVVLYRSHLGRGPARHEALERVELAVSAANRGCREA